MYVVRSDYLITTTRLVCDTMTIQHVRRCMRKTAGVLMIILLNSEKVNKYFFSVAQIFLKLLKVYDGFLLIAVVWTGTGLTVYIYEHTIIPWFLKLTSKHDNHHYSIHLHFSFINTSLMVWFEQLYVLFIDELYHSIISTLKKEEERNRKNRETTYAHNSHMHGRLLSSFLTVTLSMLVFH